MNTLHSRGGGRDLPGFRGRSEESVKYGDSLRGYAHPVHVRDGFLCRYCGLDGSQWPFWLCLSWDHLLPKGHPLRDDPAYIVTACRFCNESCNRTTFPDGTPEEIVAAKKAAIARVRSEYRRFWEAHVRSPGVP